MSLHQTRYEVVTTNIHFTCTAVGAARTDTSYALPSYRYFTGIDLIGEHVDQLSVFEDQIGGALPAGNFDQSSPFFQK